MIEPHPGDEMPGCPRCVLSELQSSPAGLPSSRPLCASQRTFPGRRTRADACSEAFEINPGRAAKPVSGASRAVKGSGRLELSRTTRGQHRLARYLHGLRATGEAVGETSYYEQLEKLPNAVGDRLSPRIICVLTTRRRGVGVSDGGLFVGGRGVEKAGRQATTARAPEGDAVEVKGPSEYVCPIPGTYQVREKEHRRSDQIRGEYGSGGATAACATWPLRSHAGRLGDRNRGRWPASGSAAGAS